MTFQEPHFKKQIVNEILLYLDEEIQALKQAAMASLEAATHEESQSEDKHDTRGIEASYLAGAQAARVAEIQKQMTVFRFLPVRPLTAEDVACPGALVELDCKGTRAFYFIVPQGGGLVLRVQDRPVQVITPHSPMGDALLGKKVGDLVEVEVRNGVREYKLISIG